MQGLTLLLIVDRPGAEPSALAILDFVMDGLDAALRPEVLIHTAEDVLNDRVAWPTVDAAWVILTSDDSALLEYSLLGALAEKHIPAAIASSSRREPAGTMLDPGQSSLPLDTSPQVCRAVLATLLAGSPLVRSLSTDLRLLLAQNTGMAGQFDKIDEELRMAVKIQREFLPKQLPTPEGLDIRVLWRPACYVSGDIYDVMRLDEHHVGLFIADAVGHGVPAALMTIYIKQAIKTRQITPGIGAGYRIVPPGEALASLNKAMIAQDAGSASLGTAAYGVIDTRTQRLTFARAGHPAPLLLRGDGGTRWLEPDGAMLGIFPEEIFEEVVVDLEDTDRFLIYSDGFEVAFPAAQGKGRVANVRYATEFEELRAGSGEAALDHLQDRLDLQTGSLNQRDDMTVICTSVRTLAGVAAARAKADRVEPRRSVA